MRKSASALALLGLAALLAGPAGAASAVWSPARPVHLPSRGTAVPQGYLPALACPAAGSCVAAGDYANGTTSVSGLVVTESHGVWQTGRAIVAPPDAAAAPGLTPYAVACGAVGDCTVVGSYDDATGDVQAFVDSEVSGVWRSAIRVPLPPDALGSGQVAGLRAIACPSVTRCVAAGSYTTSNAVAPVEGLVVTGAAGAWSAREIAAPAGANADPLLVLTQVACASGGACVAAGTYVDAQNATHALVADAATALISVLAPPPNVSAYPTVTVGALACAPAGPCELAGTYETAGGQLEGYVSASPGAVGARATELVMPAGAAASPRVFFYGFAGLACPGAGACATGGQYLDGQGRYQGFLANEFGGVWQPATALRLPAGAQQAGRNGGVVAVTCPAAGQCRAGAAYLDAAGRYQALVAGERHDAWTTSTTLALPAGARTVGVDGGVYGLVCPTASACTATGTYLDRAGNYQGFYASLR
ncbi:MAG: hypothetical protein ACHQFZ_08265 [Acidimicrobiales bacterium]